MHLSLTLLRLCLGELTSTELPAIIDLGNVMHEFDNLWEQSIRDIERGAVAECGGALVLDQTGDLTLVNVTVGEADQLQLNLDVGTDGLLVGTFHTHPHVSGVRGVAFGVRDFALAINSGSTLSLVHSGRYLYALIRTEFTPTTVNEDSLRNEFNKISAIPGMPWQPPSTSPQRGENQPPPLWGGLRGGFAPKRELLTRY
jgi:hypothetical protein